MRWKWVEAQEDNHEYRISKNGSYVASLYIRSSFVYNEDKYTFVEQQTIPYFVNKQIIETMFTGILL